MSALLRTPFTPDVERYVIADAGETIVDEVRKHWIAMLFPAARVLLALWLFVVTFGAPERAWWVGITISLAIGLHGAYRALEVYLDRFVITNIRVFRVHGVFTRHVATMPMTRILDIAIKVPIAGRIFGYGHFQFESAAQDQGLRNIRYVPRPYERDLTIQRAVQRSGVRGGAVGRIVADADGT